MSFFIEGQDKCNLFVNQSQKKNVWMLKFYTGSKKYHSQTLPVGVCANNKDSPNFSTTNALLRRLFACTAALLLIDNPNILTSLQAVNLHSDAHDPVITLRPTPRFEDN